MSYELKELGQLGSLATTNIQGRQVPTAQALVNRCHREATDRGLILCGTEVNLQCIPSAQNNQLAIVHAKLSFRLMTDRENTGPVFVYEALGDADATTGGRVNGRIVALAETRAISRAAGLALNVDQEMLETTGAAPAPTMNYVPPAAPGVNPAPQASGTDWMGPIPLGHNKGKMLNDPSVSINDLQWMANNLKLIDKVTPDTYKRNGCLQEIARRQGGAAPIAVAAPVQLAPVPASFSPQPLPLPTGAPAFPQNPSAPVVAGSAAAAGTTSEGQAGGIAPLPNQTVEPATVNRLVNLAMQRGLSVAQFQAYVKQNFHVEDAGLLSAAGVAQLEAVLTAA